MSQSRQLAAIMFTDIVGYTKLMGEDEQKAFELLKKNRSVQRPIIEMFNGRWLKEIGDGVLASFSTVSDAVYCAKEIQETCQNEPDLSLRIGIHQGEVVFEGNDVFGDGVNIASRLEPLAPVGGIIVSESVHRNLGNKKGIVSTFIREQQLKNVKEPIRIYSVQVEVAEPVVVAEPAETPHQVSPKARNPRKVSFAVTGVIIILLLSYFLYSNFDTGTASVEAPVAAIDKSIVVLPFTNMSNDPDQDYFSDGMMEEILNHLVKIKDLKVISRTTAMQYKGTTKSVHKITEELNVATALEGSVRKDGDQIRINVQLIEGETDTHLWSESYDRQLTNIFEVQSDVAKRIAQVLTAEIAPEVRLRIESQPTTNAEAYNRYLQAKALVIAGSHLAGIKLFEEAIAIDPEFADAYAELGYWKTIPWREDVLEEPFDPVKAVRIAAPYYNKALEIDPNNLAAHGHKARMHLWYEWDFEAAEKEVSIMKRLNPTSSLPGLLLATGKFDEFLKGSEQALEVDPLDPYQWTWKILGLYFTNQHDLALETIEEAKKLHDIIIDQTGLWSLDVQSAYVYSYLGMYEEAISTLEKYNVGFPIALSIKAIAYFHLGQADKSNQLIGEIKTSFVNLTGLSTSTSLAMIYAQMGEVDTAFEWLEKAYEDHDYWMFWIQRQLFFKPIYNDPRWQKMLDKAGFPD